MSVEAESIVRSNDGVLQRLFTPIKVGRLELKNRIMMPPMIDRLAVGGMVSERVKDFYAARAKGGVALIVLTPGIVDISVASSIQLGLYDDRFIPSLNELTDVVHANGALMGIQLMHLGRQGGGIKSYRPVAPSPIPVSPHDELPRELATGEVEDLVEKFAEAARRARDAGFDMVDLHGCHGYLLSGFLSPHTNKRSDKYGGSVEGRARFAVEIVRAIKDRVGRDFPVGCRINGADYMPGGVTLDMAKHTARLLEEAGADLIGVSGGAYGSYPVIVPPYDQPRGCNAPLAKGVKEVVKVPVAVAGRLDDPRTADDILASGKADLVAVARGLLVDPEMPNKALRGEFREIRPCIACNVCIDANATEPITCTVNPEAGREREMEIQPASGSKRVVVIGGGVAGLEAARVAALRGHRVSLYEEDGEVGGQWRLAAKPPHKQDHTRLLDYLSGQLEKLGVECRLGKKVSPAMVESLNPDVVIVAIGAVPLVPPIPGIDCDRVTSAWDVLRGHPVGRRVLVIGGGMTGLETAEFLAWRGGDVVVVEQLKHAGADMGGTVRWHLMNRIRSQNIQVLTSAQVREIKPDGAVVVLRNGSEETLGSFDTIVVACGAVSRDGLSAEIRNKASEVYMIGDAAGPRRGLEAIREGSETGRKI